MTRSTMTAQHSARTTSGKRKRHSRHSALVGSASALVLAALAWTAPAHAQRAGFQGTPQYNDMDISILPSGSATDVNINVLRPQAVINWTPDDRGTSGTINFLPEANTVSFNGSGSYTVLNRIIPLDTAGNAVARDIALNGTVTSSPGGNIWFYSPGGILVGANAQFTVGSLLLTTREIDQTGGLFGPTGEIRFRNPTVVGTDNSAVIISAGATISETNNLDNAYVAIVAPRIEQRGTITTHGAAALVSAEVADIRINNGLFDISVTVGSGADTGIIHTGTTMAYPDVSSTSTNRIYMVAVPKNQAMAMLVGGMLEMNDASNVNVNPDGAIVLSAGYNVANGVIDTPAPTTGGSGSISINDANFGASLDARASNSITVRPATSCSPDCGSALIANQTLFRGDATLTADNNISMVIGQAQQIQADGNLYLTAGTPGMGGAISIGVDAAPPVTAGTSGPGYISVEQGLILSANANGAAGINGGAAQGGTITIGLNNGELLADYFFADVTGTGAYDPAATNAIGRGGTITATLDNASRFEVSTVSMNGAGRGGNNDTTGFSGFGGTVNIAQANESIFEAGDFSVNVDGSGTIVGGGTPLVADGVGGSALVTIANSQIQAGSINFTANGTGGAGGTGRGGNLGWTIDDIAGPAASDISGSMMRLTADGYGSTADGLAAPGIGVGGTVSYVQNDGTVTLNRMELSVNGRGGNGSVYTVSPPDPIFDGANGQGGTATVAMAGGSFLVGDGLGVTADGFGGTGAYSFDSSGGFVAAGNGGNGTGGVINATFTDVATVGQNPNLPGTPANIVLQAQGTGGTGGDFYPSSSVPPSGTTAASGGNGRGGIVNTTITSASVAADLTLNSDAFGGQGGRAYAGGTGGTATGGTSHLTLGTPPTTSLTSVVSSLAIGGNGGDANEGEGGTGGAATGGTGQLTYTGPGITATTDASNITVSGTGGAGGQSYIFGSTTPTAQNTTGGTGGAGTGGTLLLEASNGATLLIAPPRSGFAVLQAVGTGGMGGTGANIYTDPPNPTAVGGAGGLGGTGTGGTVELRASGGHIALAPTATAFTIDVSGSAGAGGVGGMGLGGQGPTPAAGVVRDSGGLARLSTGTLGGVDGTIDLPALTINADGDDAGRIELLNTTAGTGIRLGSLDAHANGLPVTSPDFLTSGSGILMSAGAGTILIAGPATLDTTGTVRFDADGGGRTRSDGLMTVTANDITGNRSNASGTAVLSAGSLVATAANDIAFAPDTRIETDGTATITAGRNLTVGDIAGSSDVTLAAPGVVRAGTVSTTGTGTLSATAGTDLAINTVNTAGTTTLSAVNGSATLGAVTSGGDALINANIVDIGAGSAVGLFSTTATDTLDFTTIAGGTVDLTAQNTITGQTITSSGDATVTSALGNIALTDVTANNLVTLIAQNGSVTGQSLQSGDRAAIDAASITFGTINSLGIVDLTATGDLTASNIAAGSQILVQAGSVSATGGNWQAGGDITVNATGSAALGSLQSNGNIAVTAAQITGNAATTTGGGTVTLSGANGVSMAAVTASGAAQLTAPNGAIRVDLLSSNGPVTADGQSVAITGSGDLTFATLRASGGDAAVNTTNGGLTVTNATAAGTLSLGAANALTVNGAQAQAITLQSGDTAVLNGGVSATNALNVTSAGLTSVNGIANGQTVSIVSGDIDIASGGRIGVAGTTTTLSLRNGNSLARTYIGGNGQAGTYSLTAAEIARLYGDSIAVTAPVFTGMALLRLSANANPDVIVDSFTLNGGGGSGANIGTNGSFTIQTPGTTRIVGAVEATNMSATNTLAIIADTALEVPLGQGRVRLSGSSPNGLSGILTLQSDDVAVMTSQALGDVAALTDVAAIEQRLALNDGLTLTDSPLAAGTLRLIGRNSILVQNTAVGTTYAARRGFVANRLEMITGSGVTRIVVNGQVTDPQNVLLSGLEAIGASLINGVPPLGMGSFDRASTFNGCRIVGVNGCRGSFAPFPVQDVVEYSSDEDREDEQGANNPQILIDMREVDTLTDQPMLDEPITGSGNDDLWGPVPTP